MPGWGLALASSCYPLSKSFMCLLSMDMSVVVPEMVSHRPVLEFWQPSCSPRPQESLVSEYYKHGLFKIRFFHQSLEEEGLSQSPLYHLPQKNFLPSEEVIHEWAFPCDKTRFPFFCVKASWSRLGNPLLGREHLQAANQKCSLLPGYSLCFWSLIPFLSQAIRPLRAFSVILPSIV